MWDPKITPRMTGRKPERASPVTEESNMKLKDRVAFLTGAAGAGIGQATARLLAKEGANVVITDAHGERSRTVAKEIAEEMGVNTRTRAGEPGNGGKQYETEG